MKLEQTPWNITEVFCISGNQKKGTPCIRKAEQRKPLHSIRTPSPFACLPHGVELEITVQYFVSYSQTLVIFRAEVLSSELRLLMSFSWSFFPEVVWTSFFSPHCSPGFWDSNHHSIPKRCKGVNCVDLGESFPTSIYLQNLASIQPRTSLVKFARSPRTEYSVI